MIARSLLLLIPFTMYLVSTTDGCGRGDLRILEKYWLDEELSELTDMKMAPEVLDIFLEVIHKKEQYRKLQDEIDRLRLTMEKELAEIYLLEKDAYIIEKQNPKLKEENQRKKEKAFSSFKLAYTHMYNDMTKFLRKLLKKLKRRDLSEVHYLKGISHIMSPNDAFFDIKHTSLVLERWKKTVNTLKLVLMNVDRYASKENLKMFTKYKKILDWWIPAVESNAIFLRLESASVD
ncbi:uncharacterized protein LOC106077095 isoform X2 [Biomphalaria glabrata]|uniref:Uncharacterized protein LOC106077095 isoform X2 n=1 Tax=Biomphalaria glabrata TaxID=6526 RepID=A0A9W2ZNC5_BIOGL|nr:uncharacterized protein LOC106077095 isoform X2 [Biomphalaria glabrata]